MVPIQLAGWLLWALHVHDLADEKFRVLFNGGTTLVADVMQMCWLPVSAVVLENRGMAAIRATADTISARLVKQDQVYGAPLCVVGCHALSAVHFRLLEF